MLLSVCLLLHGCKTEDDEGAGSPDTAAHTAVGETGKRPSSPFIDDTVAFMQRLIGLQRDVRANPDDTTRIGELLGAAFDTAGGSFFAVGMGLPNPGLPDAAARAGQRRAAEKDAQRWSLYMKLWHLGNITPFGTEIEGRITWSRSLRHIEKGDTLFQLMMAPLGGVSVGPGNDDGAV